MKYNIDKKFLKEKYEELGSIRATSKELKIPNSTVRYFLKKYEIQYKKQPNRRTKNRIILDEVELKTKYSELKNVKKVAEYFAVSQSKIKKSFNEFNITYDKFVKPKFDEFILEIDTPESFYLAGFIAADGNINKNTLQISISIKDMQHLNKLKQILRFEGNIKIVKGKPSYINERKINGGDTVRLICTSIKMKNDLKKFNILPNKSKTYDFPEWLVDHPLAHHFMRGYFDGDGSIGVRKLKNQNKLRWSLVGNIWFLEKYQHILERECKINHNEIYKRTDTFGQLEYQGNIIVPKVCDFLYNNSTCHLDRKYNIYKDWKINYA